MTLEETDQKLSEINFMGMTEQQIGLAFNLLEHEIQHHGQLDRGLWFGVQSEG
jgi:hypothetical protein